MLKESPGDAAYIRISARPDKMVRDRMRISGTRQDGWYLQQIEGLLDSRSRWNCWPVWTQRIEEQNMAVKSLPELANHHGTDKGTAGPSREWGANNYTDVYEAYLERLRVAPIKILEIGLGVVGDKWASHIVHGRNTGGASLKMWYDYFPKAQIYGIDINSCPYLDNDRIKTYVADQSSVADMEAFTKATSGVEFDVIIDDGSHRPDHQQITLGYFFKSLKSGGLFFIEDLFSNGLGDSAKGRHACGDVCNTRSVLKNFRDHGKFLEPNSLINQSYLSDKIASLHFHVPKTAVELSLRASLRKPFRKAVRYRPDSELLCAIRKK
jgi:hypothetical protein